MRLVRVVGRRLGAVLLAGVGLAAADGGGAQTTKMPSTLRYGSGYLDVPVASVLPHKAVTVTYSAFSVALPNRLVTNSQGEVSGLGESVDRWVGDASTAIGLFDRVELGASFQHFADANNGGRIVGAFGRIAILRPLREGVGLAVGARYLTSPSFDAHPGAHDYQPGRLGFPDDRLYRSYGEVAEEVATNFTPYAVASIMLRGFESDLIPGYDLTFTLGHGAGMFSDGGELTWHAITDTEGWFAGSALHVRVADTAILNLIGEYNGMDLNVGAQLDLGGIRIGAFGLGMNYPNGVSEYRSRKFGLLASMALCPSEGWLCVAELMDRPPPDTIILRLPAPPPDTVVIDRPSAPPRAGGSPADLCLATGESVSVVVTPQGDTLVGSDRVSIRALRPGIAFAGRYAGGADWFESDEGFDFGGRGYRRSGRALRLDCANIMRVGEHQGVPVFAVRSAESPYPTLYLPVKPGIWQGFQIAEPGIEGRSGGRGRGG